jgi:uncharacterized membrane protein YdjX (TVP38/TMEM64 family)
VKRLKYGGIAILILIALGLALRYLAFGGEFSLSAARADRDELLGLAGSLPVAYLLYGLIYPILALLFVPAALILSVASGFVFGLAGAPLMLASIALGDSLCALFVRRLMGPQARAAFAERLRPLAGELEKRGLRYFVTARLIPFIPCSLSNALAGLSRFSLPRYGLCAFLSSAPAIFLYAWAGSELARVDRVADLLRPEFVAAFALMAGLSILGILRSRRSEAKAEEGSP